MLRPERQGKMKNFFSKMMEIASLYFEGKHIAKESIIHGKCRNFHDFKSMYTVTTRFASSKQHKNCYCKVIAAIANGVTKLYRGKYIDFSGESYFESITMKEYFNSARASRLPADYRHYVKIVGLRIVIFESASPLNIIRSNFDKCR